MIDPSPRRLLPRPSRSATSTLSIRQVWTGWRGTALVTSPSKVSPTSLTSGWSPPVSRRRCPGSWRPSKPTPITATRPLTRRRTWSRRMRSPLKIQESRILLKCFSYAPAVRSVRVNARQQKNVKSCTFPFESKVMEPIKMSHQRKCFLHTFNVKSWTIFLFKLGRRTHIEMITCDLKGVQFLDFYNRGLTQHWHENNDGLWTRSIPFTPGCYLLIRSKESFK